MYLAIVEWKITVVFSLQMNYTHVKNAYKKAKAIVPRVSWRNRFITGVMVAGGTIYGIYRAVTGEPLGEALPAYLLDR
jgi:hypothetical protein